MSNLLQSIYILFIIYISKSYHYINPMKTFQGILPFFLVLYLCRICITLTSRLLTVISRGAGTSGFWNVFNVGFMKKEKSVTRNVACRYYTVTTVSIYHNISVIIWTFSPLESVINIWKFECNHRIQNYFSHAFHFLHTCEWYWHYDYWLS